MMNVKRAAIVALGNVAEYTEGHFAPHLDPALQCLRILADYFHHEIRERAAIALQQVAHAACLAHGGDARALPYERGDSDEKEPKAIRWTKGDVSVQLPASLAQYVQDCMGLLARLLSEDTAKSVVAVACESLNELVQDVGPAALLPRLPAIVEATVALATNAAPCQTSRAARYVDLEVRQNFDGMTSSDDPRAIPRRCRDASSDDPRGNPAAVPRRVLGRSTRQPRGGAATRPRNIHVATPRRCRDASSDDLRGNPAAVPRRILKAPSTSWVPAQVARR